MSSYISDSNGKKRWANYESDSDQEEEAHHAVEEGTPAVDGDDIEDEEDDLDNELNLSKLSPITLEIKLPKKMLSKREKLLAKQKELEDLDSILAEYRDLTVGDSALPEEVVVVQEEMPLANSDAKIKRKKKKKQEKLDAPPTNDNNANQSSANNVDISAVLQARIVKKTFRPKGVDAQKIALEEALKANTEKKKKKADKSKFNEGSY